MKNLKRSAFGLSFLIALLFLQGCDTSRPRDAVADCDCFVIYAVKERDNKVNGNYEYWVRDKTSQGWRFLTDKKYNVGDKLTIK